MLLCSVRKVTQGQFASRLFNGQNLGWSLGYKGLRVWGKRHRVRQIRRFMKEV
jgi:hypothetical protein